MSKFTHVVFAVVGAVSGWFLGTAAVAWRGLAADSMAATVVPFIGTLLVAGLFLGIAGVISREQVRHGSRAERGLISTEQRAGRRYGPSSR